MKTSIIYDKRQHAKKKNSSSHVINTKTLLIWSVNKHWLNIKNGIF